MVSFGCQATCYRCREKCANTSRRWSAHDHAQHETTLAMSVAREHDVPQLFAFCIQEHSLGAGTKVRNCGLALDVVAFEDRN